MCSLISFYKVKLLFVNIIVDVATFLREAAWIASFLLGFIVRAPFLGPFVVFCLFAWEEECEAFLFLNPWAILVVSIQCQTDQ